MRHFTRFIRIGSEWHSLEWGQYKSRNMYISDLYYVQDNGFRVVMSYDTIIGFISEVDNTFITWGYSEYSTTTSKQITMLCNEQDLKIEKVSKYTYNYLDMLDYYLHIYMDIEY